MISLSLFFIPAVFRHVRQRDVTVEGVLVWNEKIILENTDPVYGRNSMSSWSLDHRSDS